MSTGGGYIAQVVRAIMHTEALGVSCMPNAYEQSMDARTGILTTKLTFLKEIHVTVEAFLTDDGIWGEKVKIEKCPEELNFKIGFGVTAPDTGAAWTSYPHTSDFHVELTENEIPFSYSINTKKGLGTLLPADKFTKISEGIDFFFHPKDNAVGMYETVREGDTFS